MRRINTHVPALIARHIKEPKQAVGLRINAGQAPPATSAPLEDAPRADCAANDPPGEASAVLVALENTRAAWSATRDMNFAAEAGALTRAQILVSSGLITQNHRLGTGFI